MPESTLTLRQSRLCPPSQGLGIWPLENIKPAAEKEIIMSDFVRFGKEDTGIPQKNKLFWITYSKIHKRRVVPDNFENINDQKICLDICFHSHFCLWMVQVIMNTQLEGRVFLLKSPFPSSAYFEHVKKGKHIFCVIYFYISCKDKRIIVNVQIWSYMNSERYLFSEIEYSGVCLFPEYFRGNCEVTGPENGVSEPWRNVTQATGRFAY